MTRFFTLFFAICFASIATAENFPARYSVSGVAADDVLNIRALPQASSDKLGEYPPYSINIEVLRLSDNGKWGMVGAGEGNGWVSMRYLQPAPPSNQYEIPRPFTCIGTEPFWALSLSPRGSDFSEPGYDLEILKETGEAVTQNAYLATFELGPTLTYTLIAERAQCSDGMSDREFGFSARLFREAPDGNRFLRGCCTMDQNR